MYKVLGLISGTVLKGRKRQQKPKDPMKSIIT